MSSGSAPKPPTDYFKGTTGSAVNNAYGQTSSYGSMPNYGQQTFQQYQPTFAGASAPSGWDPSSAVSNGNSMVANSQQLSPYIMQLFQQGFDPQNALYGRTAHDTGEQIDAGLSKRGLDMSPYGAGVYNKGMSDFNIDWQNNQLGRATQAAGAAGGLQSTQNAGIQGGTQLAAQGPQWQAQIAQMMSQLGNNSYAFPQSVINDWMNYANAGSGSAQNRYSDQYQNWNQQNTNNNAMWSGLGNMAGSAASMAMFASDRDLKYDITPLDDVLVERLLATDIPSWRYNWETADMPKHIGPMAQDMKKNFGIGTGRRIPVVDAFGVNLAVSKSLAKRVKRLEAA